MKSFCYAEALSLKEKPDAGALITRPAIIRLQWGGNLAPAWIGAQAENSVRG